MQNQTETIVNAERMSDADDAIILIGAGIDAINRELDHMKHALNLLCRETGRSKPYPDYE
jgi:hypothetical protein